MSVTLKSTAKLAQYHLEMLVESTMPIKAALDLADDMSIQNATFDQVDSVTTSIHYFLQTTSRHLSAAEIVNLWQRVGEIRTHVQVLRDVAQERPGFDNRKLESLQKLMGVNKLIRLADSVELTIDKLEALQ